MLRPRSLPSLCLASLPLLTQAITVDITNSASIKSAASTVAYGMMSYYQGNVSGGTPGFLAQPYYWWEAGAMFGHMVDYWYYTGDTTYNAEVVAAIDWQASQNGNFMPANQTADEGNDDQVFWAFAAMEAAELNFESPAAGYPSWLAMAQAVFNEQAGRWDTETCGGGLRWQIFPTNNGYDYRNVASNGGFFQLASRLARYTGNTTYVQWAEKSFDWFASSVLLNPQTYAIYDGSSDLLNCTDANHIQWTYNYGIYLAGLAYIYNHTEDAKWITPMEGILNATLTEFFPVAMGPQIMVEVTCEPHGTCTTDDYTFKSFLARWLALTAQLYPASASRIWPYLQTSGNGAAGQCSGGSTGTVCGFEWNTTTYDNTGNGAGGGPGGVGQEMSALAVIQANLLLVDNLGAPYTTKTGGVSKGDPSAGTETGASSGGLGGVYTDTISTSDKAGAGILTAFAIVLTLGGAAWLVTS